MTRPQANKKTTPVDRALSGLLSHHFGDGLVYLQGAQDHSLLAEAKAKGLVSEDGYLTNAGYSLWRQIEA